MKPYPIMMNLEGKEVLVIGGGRVAFRKVGGLLESGALVTLISPEIDDGLKKLSDSGKIRWIAERFQESLMHSYSNVALIFGTTDRRDVNVRIFEASMHSRIPCNIADMPDLCTFFVPAVINQGDLLIAVSTGGSSPALARRIREELEKKFGPEYAVLTKLLGELRSQVVGTGSNPDENKKLFLEILDSEMLAALRENDMSRALEILEGILPQHVDPGTAIRETTFTSKES